MACKRKKCTFKSKARYSPDNVLEYTISTGKCKIINGKTGKSVKVGKYTSKIIKKSCKFDIVEKVFNRFIIVKDKSGQQKHVARPNLSKHDRDFKKYIKQKRSQTEKNKILGYIKKMARRYTLPATGNLYISSSERKKMLKKIDSLLKLSEKYLKAMKTPKKVIKKRIVKKKVIKKRIVKKPVKKPAKKKTVKKKTVKKKTVKKKSVRFGVGNQGQGGPRPVWAEKAPLEPPFAKKLNINPKIQAAKGFWGNNGVRGGVERLTKSTNYKIYPN